MGLEKRSRAIERVGWQERGIEEDKGIGEEERGKWREGDYKKENLN